MYFKIGEDKMPYIKQNFRDSIDKELDALAEKIKQVHEDNPKQTRDGLINYALTRMLNNIYADARYHDMNEIIGVLECCKLEYYRKLIAPYEDQKEHENGEVKRYDSGNSKGY